MIPALNNDLKFFLSATDPFKFPDKCFDFWLELINECTEIFPVMDYEGLKRAQENHGKSMLKCFGFSKTAILVLAILVSSS